MPLAVDTISPERAALPLAAALRAWRSSAACKPPTEVCDLAAGLIRKRTPADTGSVIGDEFERTSSMLYRSQSQRT